MEKTFGDLLRSAEQSPSYWMQVALLEFFQSLDAMRAGKSGLSRKELAERVGVSQPTLSRWLSGNENLTVSTMCRLAAAMDAAVHIHVADKNDRGRWLSEAGMASNDEGGQKPQGREEVADLQFFKARRNAQIAVTSSDSESNSTPKTVTYSSGWRRANG